MAKTRIVARLDVKGENLIKGVHLEGLRIIGDPHDHAQLYYNDGIDEIIYMDTVASLYGRNNLTDIVARTAHDVFVPITVGGGIRSVDDVARVLRAGGDKVAVNTAVVGRPELISEIARRFGSQCMVLSVEAKRREAGRWECLTDNARETTGLDVVEWVCRAVELGAGEVLLTSVDQEGTRKGFDLELISAVTARISVPVIASGGLGSPSDLVEAVVSGGASAVAVADALHYRRHSAVDFRKAAKEAGIVVRQL
jgi:cyclase